MKKFKIVLGLIASAVIACFIACILYQYKKENLYEDGYLYLKGDVRGSSFRDVWKPQAWHYSGKYNRTYWTWIDKAGNIKASYYDHRTKKTGSIYQVAPFTDYLINRKHDITHANPTMGIDNDGYIHIFYGCHNSDMKYRRSIKPENLSAFSEVFNIISNATYPNVAVTHDNKIIMVYRMGRKTPQHLQYTVSADRGNTWTESTTLFATTDSNIYPLGVVLGNERPIQSIHLIATPRLQHIEFQKLYYMKSLDGGITWEKADGTCLQIPVNQETADCIESSTPAYPGDIKLNSLNEPYILYSLNKTFKFARWNGSKWVKSTIAAIALTTFEHAEFEIISDDIIDAYLIEGTRENFRGGNIQRWRSTNRGFTWIKIEDITTDATENTRHFFPKTVYNNTDDLKILWLYGNPTSEGGEKVSIKSYPIKINFKKRKTARNLGLTIKT